MAVNNQPQDKAAPESKITPRKAASSKAVPERKATVPQSKGNYRTPVKGQPESQNKDYTGTPLSITGIRTGVLHSTITKIVLGLLILIFALGVLFTGQLGSGPDSGPAGRTAAGAGPDPVALVAGQNIARSRFEQTVERQMQFAKFYGQQSGPADQMGARQQALQSLVEDAVLYKAAQDAGIQVSDEDTDRYIDKQIDDQIKSERGQNEAAFRRQVEAEHGSEEAYREAQRKNYDREAVQRIVMLEKLEKQVKDDNKVTEEDYKRSQTKLNLRQIVVRPKLPPASEKDLKAAQQKNEADAKARTEKIAAQLKAAGAGAKLAAQFSTVAKKESDDTPTKALGGALGWKLPSDVPVGPAVKEALQKATTDLVGPVEDEASKSFYMFLIAGRKLELPKDYAKKKAQLLKDFETQRDNDVWAARRTELTKATTPEVYDPALQAFKIQSEQVYTVTGAEQARLRNEALQKYEESLKYASTTQDPAIRYQMAQLYRELNQPEKAVESLKAVVKESQNAAATRIELARLLREQKKNKESLEQLQAVSKELTDNPPPPAMFGGNPADQMRFQLSTEYDLLGRKDLAAAERKKIAPPSPGMGGGMGGMMGGAPGSIQIPGR